jgi:hypothetical protein
MQVCDSKYQAISSFTPKFKRWFLDYLFERNYAPYYIESLNEVWDALKPSFDKLRSDLFEQYKSEIKKENNSSEFCSLKVEAFFKNSFPSKVSVFRFFDSQKNLFDTWFASEIYARTLSEANSKFALMENLLQQSLLLHKRFHANNPLSQDQIIELSNLIRNLVDLLISNFISSTNLQIDRSIRIDNNPQIQTYLMNLLSYPLYFEEQVGLSQNTKTLMDQIVNILDLREVKDCPPAKVETKVVEKKNNLNKILLGTTILSVGYLIYKQVRKPKASRLGVQMDSNRVTEEIYSPKYAQTNIEPILMQAPTGQPQQFEPVEIDEDEITYKPYLGQ